MTRKEILLTLLSEECNETAQRASKAIRFGLDEVQEGQPFTNADRIVYEFNDLLAVMELMADEGLIPRVRDTVAVALKKIKIEKWLNYSISCGTLEK